MPNMRFVEAAEYPVVKNVEECKLNCLSNCFCFAYSYNNECSIYKGTLKNLEQLSSDNKLGGDFHVRVSMGSKIKLSKKVAWIVVLIVLILLIGIVLSIIWRHSTGALKEVEFSLIMFKYRAIAVKKIRSLEQGDKQFRAEISTIGAIQHVNLLRLRGFCVEVSKRFLVYDYMPKDSLESHLFQKVSKILDWKTRYHIAIGIAKGLAYLHKKCRDCIIHFDIKPENILLDDEYNPKVADFGLAKIIGRDFNRVLTIMRGTRGYLAPEWISGEAVTPKVDVFQLWEASF